MTSNAPPAARFPHRRHPLRRRQLPPPPTALPRRPLLQAPEAVALTITPHRRHPLNTSTPLRRRQHHPPAAGACITRRQIGTTQRRHRRTQLSLTFRFTITPLRRRRPRRLLLRRKACWFVQPRCHLLLLRCFGRKKEDKGEKRKIVGISAEFRRSWESGSEVTARTVRLFPILPLE